MTDFIQAKCYPVGNIDKSQYTENKVVVSVNGKPLGNSDIGVFAKHGNGVLGMEFETFDENGVPVLLKPERGEPGVSVEEFEFTSTAGDGVSSIAEIVKGSFKDLTPEEKASLKGEKGDEGKQGIQGKQGVAGDIAQKQNFLDKATYDPNKVGRDVFNYDNMQDGITFVGVSKLDKERWNKSTKQVNANNIEAYIGGAEDGEKYYKYFTKDNLNNGYMRLLAQNIDGRELNKMPTWYLPSKAGKPNIYPWSTGLVSKVVKLGNPDKNGICNQVVREEALFRFAIDTKNKQILLRHKTGLITFGMNNYSSVSYTGKDVLKLAFPGKDDTWYGTIYNPLFDMWIVADLKNKQIVVSGRQNVLLPQLPDDKKFANGEA